MKVLRPKKRNHTCILPRSGGEITVVREGTNGVNGLALTKDGELLFAEGDGKRISKRGKDGTITTLTEGAPGILLLAPNGLIMDAKGGIYFTDPGPRPVVPGRTTHVFYLPADDSPPTHTRPASNCVTATTSSGKP
jgi:sugar lactone lactonase YvrE